MVWHGLVMLAAIGAYVGLTISGHTGGDEILAAAGAYCGGAIIQSKVASPTPVNASPKATS